MTISSRTNRRSTRTTSILLVLSALLLALVIGLGFAKRHNHQNSYALIINQFNVALGDNNKAAVLALESSAFKQALETETTSEKNTKGETGVIVTNNFYNIAKSNGELYMFNSAYLAHMKTTFSTYKTAMGLSGISETFKTRTNDYGVPNYSPVFYIDAIPIDHTWRINYVGVYASATAETT